MPCHAMPLDVFAGADMSMLKEIKVRHRRNGFVFEDSIQQLYRSFLSSFLPSFLLSSLPFSSNASSRGSSRRQFRSFMQAIWNKQSREVDRTVEFFSKLKSTRDLDAAEVRLEPIVHKLCTYLSSQIRRTALNRTLPDSTMNSTMWLLKALHRFFQSKMGSKAPSHERNTPSTSSSSSFFGSLRKAMSQVSAAVEEIMYGDLHVHPLENAAVEQLRHAFNENGVTVLCLDLLAIGIEKQVCFQAITLLNALLSKPGGSPLIQQTVNEYLRSADSVLFFELLKDMIEYLKVGQVR
jgi:hypothetical protein